MQILIVEDDRQLAEMVAKSLGEVGFSATLAATGEEGLDWIRGHVFDAVITDVMMPKMDGFEFVRRGKRYQSSSSPRRAR